MPFRKISTNKGRKCPSGRTYYKRILFILGYTIFYIETYNHTLFMRYQVKYLKNLKNNNNKYP